MFRNFVSQWTLFIFVLIFLITIFYLTAKVSYLEENYKLLCVYWFLNNCIITPFININSPDESQLKYVILDEAVEFKKTSGIKNDIPFKERIYEASNFDDAIIVYNRVPKTASTSFVGLVYDLCKYNKYHVLHINITNNMHMLTLSNQVEFAQNISQWHEMKPAFYHGHMAFLNFQKFGLQKTPLFLNILRKPLDRFTSYYYFLRYGDDFRPHLIRKKHGDTKTLDECVEQGQPDCDPRNMWLQIPFLCGHDPACLEVGNIWALEEAKRNLRQYYLLVGLTEELDEFIRVLELLVPRFFRGAHDYFIHHNKSHLRHTTQKKYPSQNTIIKIKESSVWKMENELYNFARTHFHEVKKRLIDASKQDINQHFMYEKIRPKSN